MIRIGQKRVAERSEVALGADCRQADLYGVLPKLTVAL
jgi:hypothetical protein